MMISTKGRYALTVMIYLADHSGGRYVPLKEIAEAEDISEKYLENIISVLSRVTASGRDARQGRRVPADARSVGILRWGDLTAGGRASRAGILSRADAQSL